MFLLDAGDIEIKTGCTYPLEFDLGLLEHSVRK